MTKATPPVLLIAVLLLAGGCSHGGANRGTSDWMKSVNSIKPGTTMDRVKDSLGAPDEKRHGVTPVRPYPPTGSPEGVLGTLPPDTRYEEWIYRRGDSRYHVFFARSADESHKWEVIAVRSAAATAVY
jgi:hypothetical protein